MDEKVVFSMANWYTATREKTRPGQPGTIRNWRNAMSLPPPTFRCLFATLIMAIIVLSFTVDAPAKTWIVDDSGGPGVDFTDIQPAIEAAVAGDLILVYTGSYGYFNSPFYPYALIVQRLAKNELLSRILLRLKKLNGRT